MQPTKRRATAWASLAVLAAIGDPTEARAETQPTGPVAATIEAKRAELIELRHDLHRHPEIAGQEARTAGVVAARLEKLGLEVRRGVGGHGVVAVLKGGKPGPVVALRADMDAVASADPDPVEYASEIPGVRHICGHDVHTAVAVGVAEGLAPHRDRIAGTVKFLFQPAEETGAGAKAMVEAGAMTNPRPAAVFAFHTAPLEVGQIGSTVGMLLPSTALLNVTLEAAAEASPDFEATAQAISNQLQALTAIGPAADPEGVSALHQVPLSSDFIVAQPFGFEAGAHPKQWILRALLRTSSDEKLAMAKSQIAESLAALDTTGLTYELSYVDRAIPGAFNDPALVRGADAAFRKALGDDALVRMAGGVPFFGEDFAHFHAEIPGAMYWLGVSNSKKGFLGMPHDPNYVADDEAIIVGAKSMSAVLLSYLSDPG